MKNCKQIPGEGRLVTVLQGKYYIYIILYKLTDVLYEKDKDEINADTMKFEINFTPLTHETLKIQKSEDEFCNGIILLLLEDKKK